MHCRQQLCAGQRAGARVPDRVLLGRFLRADGLGARAHHAEGLRVQVPARPGHHGRPPRANRRRPRLEARAQARADLLQEDR